MTLNHAMCPRLCIINNLMDEFDIDSDVDHHVDPGMLNPDDEFLKTVKALMMIFHGKDSLLSLLWRISMIILNYEYVEMTQFVTCR